MAITVQIQNQHLEPMKGAKISDTAPVAKLISALVTQLELPITDASGTPMSYHLVYNERRLQDEDTLASVGVQEGGALTIVPEMTAGGRLGVCSQLSTSEPPLLTLDRTPPTPRPLARFPSFGVTPADNKQVTLYMHQTALVEIYEHASATPDREVGGILTGEVYEEGGRYIVVVESICRAHHVHSSPVSLQFTADTWVDIFKARSAYPERRSLGWYHSHPGIGVFLSGTDEFTHQSFFGNQPWYVAVVVDPISGELGAFTWEQGELRRYSEIGVL